jgi:phosphate transport system permease protein
MSDAQTIDSGRPAAAWGSEDARKRLRRRYAADRRLQAYGITAIAFAIGLLGVLLASLITTGYLAFFQTKVALELYIDPAKVDAQDPAKGNFRAIVREAMTSQFPQAATDKQKTELTKILTSDAAYIVRDYVVSHPQVIGQRITLPIAVSDPFDQLYKGVIPREVEALSYHQMRWFERLQNRGLVVEADGHTAIKLDVYVDPARIQGGDPPTGDFAAVARDSLQS